MTLEQFPKPHEHDPAHIAETLENSGEQIDNKGYEGAVNASFVLIGAALGLIGTEGCDINKVVAPETQTKIITVTNTVEKKFDQGIITFNRCAPTMEKYGSRTIEVSQSFIAVEDAARVEEKGKKSYYGARFIKERPDNTENTFIAVNFFVDNREVYEEPCKMQQIEGSPEKKDRYQFLVQNLNLRLNVFNALKQTSGADEELGATRAHVEEFVRLLDKEFPHTYDRTLVENIVQN